MRPFHFVEVLSQRSLKDKGAEVEGAEPFTTSVACAVVLTLAAPDRIEEHVQRCLRGGNEPLRKGNPNWLLFNI